MSEAMRYAGWWRRVLATAIDAVLFVVPYGALSLVLDGWAREAAWMMLALGLYVWLLSCPWQATPGMKCLGVKAVDVQGNRLKASRVAAWYGACLLMMAVALAGLVYMQWAFDIKAAGEQIEAGNLAMAEQMLGISLTDYMQRMMIALAWCALVLLVWSISIARGKQKAGFINQLCGIRFVRS